MSRCMLPGASTCGWMELEDVKINPLHVRMAKSGRTYIVESCRSDIGSDPTIPARCVQRGPMPITPQRQSRRQGVPGLPFEGLSRQRAHGRAGNAPLHVNPFTCARGVPGPSAGCGVKPGNRSLQPIGAPSLVDESAVHQASRCRHGGACSQRAQLRSWRHLRLWPCRQQREVPAVSIAQGAACGACHACAQQCGAARNAEAQGVRGRPTHPRACFTDHEAAHNTLSAARCPERMPHERPATRAAAAVKQVCERRQDAGIRARVR